jgi:secreted PhoX family phosphatase
MNRKDFLKNTFAVSLGFSGFRTLLENSLNNYINIEEVVDMYGPLLKDPDGILDLPKGFSYKVISKKGDMMSDGFHVPGRADGMATFQSDGDNVIVLRNHEISDGEVGVESAFGKDWELVDKLDTASFYDAGVSKKPADGGTTTIVFNTRTQEVEKEFLSLAGTLRNCAGGPTPWNTWLTCEEIVLEKNNIYAKDHGYVFEVPATTDIQLADPKPIMDMGRFNHEAVAIDPESGVVYLTEDDSEGLLYRFIPNEKENMHAGGRLQALMVLDQPSLDSRNWDAQHIAVGEVLKIRWIDLNDIHKDDLRFRGFAAGATRFARGEGMWQGNNAIYFACTNGGAKKNGQIWKYIPSSKEGTSDEINNPGKLELFVEPDDGSVIQNADNLTVAPWGDLIVCEDGPSENYILGITPRGQVYKFAKNAISYSEMAGATFSPDGTTLFMNIQEEGLTIAITGPWI